MAIRYERVLAAFYEYGVLSVVSLIGFNVHKLLPRAMATGAFASSAEPGSEMRAKHTWPNS